MHIGYAIAFFLFVGLSETLRHGIFGLTPAEIAAITAGTLGLVSVLVLRGDLIHLLRPSRQPLYGNPRLNWSWRRSALALGSGLAGIAAAALTTTGPLSAPTALELTALQVALITLPQELFFREAVLKSFGQSLPAIYLIGLLAWFIVHMPAGLPAALAAAGAGAVWLTLRLIGVSILAVALLHAAATVMLPQLTGPMAAATWADVGYFIAASAAISATLFLIFAKSRKQGIFSYA
ncbi:MAG: CPBP family glutamic-type intramembrane protease [Pseudodonghicola sp.]